MEITQILEQFLTQEWSTGLRLTTIPQAMHRLGIVDEPSLRWRMAGRLEWLWRNALISEEKLSQIAAALGRDDVDEAGANRWRQQVNTWHLVSILLSEDEKLVARHILAHHRRGWQLPQPGESARALGLPVKEVHKALRMLARLGFLALPDKRRPASYALADSYEQFLEGLGFSFHTVTLDKKERFGVP